MSCRSIAGMPDLAGAVLAFFFRAEDGIRDGRVTGVQTCALPIYHYVVRVEEVNVSQLLGHFFDADYVMIERASAEIVTHRLRSEERRVGKECTSGWWRERW